MTRSVAHAVTTRTMHRPVTALSCSGLLFIAAAASGAAPITPNFKAADIEQIAEAVSAATGKNFVLDPRVHGPVTLLSSTPMSPEAFYEAFLAILQVHGLVAMPAGSVIKIVPDANARQMPSIDVPARLDADADEMVTQVIDVRNVSAAQLVPILRPLIPQYGQLAAYAASNMLIITDRANNVNRLVQIIRRIDQTGDQDVEIVPLQNASAAEIARIVSTVFQQQAAPEAGLPLKVIADERSNSVILSGDQTQRLRVRTLVAHLDTPLQTGGDSQVRYLKFADAEKLVPKLKEQITGIAQASAGPTGTAAAPQAVAEKGALIWADPDTNALIVTAPPKVMRAVMSIVDRLDIRRAQVLVEAVIVEVSADKTAGLGVNWAAWTEGSDGTQIPAGGFISPVGGTSAADIYAAIKSGSTDSSAAAKLNGTNFVLGKLTASGINVGAMIRAIRGDAHTNIVATPSTVTMDNQEAELKVAQEVPFLTGQFQTPSSGGSSNPFSTVQRQEVGTILKVTPQIAAEGNLVVLKISIESSSVAATSVSSIDITTNKRTISTSVLVEDGGIVVLGGLIQDSANRSEQRVPFLGNIPLLGLAFKTRDSTANKSNLMIFIRPKIMRDSTQMALTTGAKYNYMLDEQRKGDHRELLPLLPGVKSPRLPSLPAEPEEAPKKSTAPDESEAAKPRE